ncbi:glycosyltransferase, partial [Candidatus Daviesbacteria bacterium]|nr:glycosyltransferase [Candidatus Daviesbacteria bacterium]
IKNNTNRGFAPALNQGIKRSTGKYVLTTNDDVIFERKCLIELVRVVEKDKTIGILGGKMLFEGKEKLIALSGFRVNLWLGYHPYDFNGQDNLREMDVATGGCMLIRKSALAKSGFYDEGFFFCGEDYDLCFRMKIVGFKIVYVPSAIVIHKFLNSRRKKDNFPQLFAHYRGKFRFLFIHASSLQMLVFFPIQFLIGPFFSYLQSKQLTILPMVSALIWNLENLPSTLKSRHEVKKLKIAYEFKQ